MPKAFFVIVPAGKGDGARGEEGNAAFASEPFPSSLDMVFGLYETELKRYFLREYIFLKVCSEDYFLKRKAFILTIFRGKE